MGHCVSFGDFLIFCQRQFAVQHVAMLAEGYDPRVAIVLRGVRCARVRTSAAPSARRRAAANHGEHLPRRDQRAPAAPQRSVYAHAGEGRADGAREAGAAAQLILEANEHDAAPVVPEDGRLSAVQLRPAAKVVRLVVAQPGDRAAERLRHLHGRRFYSGGGAMPAELARMSKLRDVVSMRIDTVSSAVAVEDMLAPLQAVGSACRLAAVLSNLYS